jgi:hypothetical protein
MRFFVVCTSEVDGAPYVLSEVSEIAGARGDARISGGIAGDGSVVMTRAEMDAVAATRIALHAWDVGDETAFDRESAALERRTELGLGRLWVVADNDDATAPFRELERRREIDARVAHARVVRLQAIEMRARCEEVRQATFKQRRQTMALRDAMRFRTPFVKVDQSHA